MPPVLPKEDPRLISFNTLRKSVGWFGISLPAAMLLGNFAVGHCNTIQDSISHYYYTITGSMFIGILCAVAVFLIAYKGYPDDNTDNILTTLAGICAIFIAFFPTNDNSTDSCAIIHLPLSKPMNLIHYWFSAGFFVLLASVSYFKFTKSKGIKTKSKIMRNRVYRTCGVLMIICILLIAAYFQFKEQLSWLARFKPVFCLEWTALYAFGVSWLVKGEMVLADKPEEKAVA
jgi:hypothetical protein